MVETAEAAVKVHKAEVRERIANGQTLTPAQKSKAVLVTFRGVGGLNAETIVSRHHELKVLCDHMKMVEDPYSWTLPVENIRPTLNWTSKWGNHEDAMLLVGAWIHGFGNWELMIGDPNLGLANKVFLEEGKKTEEGAAKPIPNAIHLVRRGDYLLGLLREQQDKIREYEQSMRRQSGNKNRSVTPANGSTRPSSVHNSNGKRPRGDDDADTPKNSGKKKRITTPTFTESEDEYPASMDEEVVKTELRPVRQYLRQLKDKTHTRDEKVAVLKISLKAIGERIEEVVKTKVRRGENEEKWRKHLWL